MSPENAVARLGELIKEKWLNWKNLEFSLRSLYAFGAFLFLAAVIFLLISINEAASLQFEFSSHGVSTLAQIFDAPIKSIGALLGIVTLYAALKRMKANDEQVKIANAQIKIASEQNRLSNYFKFRQEFVDHFAKQEISEILASTMEKTLVENTLSGLYNFLYGNYNNFDSNMIKTTRDLINKYYEGVNGLLINKNASLKDEESFRLALSELTDFSDCNELMLIMGTYFFDAIERFTDILNLKTKTIIVLSDETQSLVKFVITNRFLSSLQGFNGFAQIQKVMLANSITFRAIHKIFRTTFANLILEVRGKKL